MANHKSALKKMRQDQKRRMLNKAVRTRYRNLVKAVRAAVESGSAAEAEEALKKAVPQLQRAAQKGVIHKKTASRNISRLTKHVQAVKG